MPEPPLRRNRLSVNSNVSSPSNATPAIWSGSLGPVQEPHLTSGSTKSFWAAAAPFSPQSRLLIGGGDRRLGSKQSRSSKESTTHWQRPHSAFFPKGDPEERLLRMEAKMDLIMGMVEDCMKGIRVLYKNSQATGGHHQSILQRNGSFHGSIPEVAGFCSPREDRSSVWSIQHRGAGGDTVTAGFSIGTEDESEGGKAAPTPTNQQDYQLSRQSQADGTLKRGISYLSSEAATARAGFTRGCTRETIRSQVSERMNEVFGHAESPAHPKDMIPNKANLKTSHSVRNFMARQKATHGSCSHMLWNFLENPSSSAWSARFNRLMPALILGSVVFSLVHAIVPMALDAPAAFYIETAIDGVFTLEILLRFCVCPNRLIFFLSAYNVIDFVSTFPLFLRVYNRLQDPRVTEHLPLDPSALLACESTCILFYSSFVPALRLLKSLRRFEQIHLLRRAFQMAIQALPVLLYIYTVIWFTFTGFIFMAEERSNVNSFGEAMWLVICCMTFSLFGDSPSPQSVAGKVILSILVLISTIYMAVPMGIMGHSFSAVWEDRDRILLVERLRTVFTQNGFTARDIPDLFGHFDPDGNGTLSLEEFMTLASSLHLGLAEDRLISLFQGLDGNDNDGIDDKEFCKIIFPEAYYFYFHSEDGRKMDGGVSWLPSFLQ